MSEQMEFPLTFEKFANEYGFKDDKEVYTNGSELISIFRVKQWLEHDNKLRAIETDTAYECGKHTKVNAVLNKIRAEIEQNIGDNPYKNDGIYCSLHVIDKYAKGDKE